MRDNTRLQVAYKNDKQTGIIGWLICKIKGWNVWHEEVIFPVRPGYPWSNKVSVADSKEGVTEREGRYSHPDRWEFVTVYEWYGSKINDDVLSCMWKEHLKHRKEPYSFTDIFFTQIFKPLKQLNDLKAWFCDEWSRHLRGKLPEAVGAEQSKKEAMEDAIAYMSKYPREFM